MVDVSHHLPGRVLLVTLTGSQAHGFATPESDTDCRAVYLPPTMAFHVIGAKVPKVLRFRSKNVEGQGWEFAHFVDLALKSNPTALEALLAPVVQMSAEGEALRDFFPYFWSSDLVRSSFLGYSEQQCKRYLDDRENKPYKFVSAWLQATYWGYELLSTGTFTVKSADTEIGPILLRWRAGRYTHEEVAEVTGYWRERLEQAFQANPSKQANPGPIEEFLLNTRYASFW